MTLSRPGYKRERGKVTQSPAAHFQWGKKGWLLGCVPYAVVAQMEKRGGRGERTNPTKPPPPISFSAFVSLLSTVPFVEVLPTSSIQGIEVTIQKFVSL